MINEFREDLVSGDWVLIASVRALRPDALRAQKKERARSPREGCPFEPDALAGQNAIIAYPNDPQKWEMAVMPNKFPILARGEESSRSQEFRKGIYRGRTAVGTAWLLITRDHNRHFDELAPKDAARVFEMLREAHETSARDRSMAYVASFYNYGPTAGASVWHPHYQILTLPVIPAHTVHSFEGAKRYYRTHRGRCVRCDIIAAERRGKTRIIAENANAVAFAPYASKEPFETSVLPKKHWPSLRETPPDALRDVALLVQNVLKKVKLRLGDPDLNYYIHDTPLDRKDYRFHHWHVEIVPRTKIDAGFEFSTGIGVNAVDPDDAAAILRGEKITSRTQF